MPPHQQEEDPHPQCQSRGGTHHRRRINESATKNPYVWFRGREGMDSITTTKKIEPCDHNGWQCHPTNRKRTHIPNVSQGEAHTIDGASTKVQQKTLMYGSVAGKGWILLQQQKKSNRVMEQKDTPKQQQQKQQGSPKTSPRLSTSDRKGPHKKEKTRNSKYQREN